LKLRNTFSLQQLATKLCKSCEPSPGKSPIKKFPRDDIIPKTSDKFTRIFGTSFLIRKTLRLRKKNTMTMPDNMLPKLKIISDPFGPIPKWLK